MTFRNILPSEQYVLITKLSMEEVCKMISENVEPESSAATGNRRLNRFYKGKISDNSFIVHRVITEGRNSFNPVIQGTISSFLDKTHVAITMKLPQPVLAFMVFWLGTVGIICVAMTLIGLYKLSAILAHGFSPMYFIPFVMFIFGSVLTTFGFKIESDKSRAFFVKLLDAEVNTDS